MVDCTQINNEPSARPLKYRAPTFCWASVDGTIDMGPIRDEGLLVEVVQVRIQHVTDDVTGLVSGGTLTLRCCVRQLHLRRMLIGGNRTSWTMTINGEDVRRKLDRPMVILDVDQPDFEEENRLGQLFCVPSTTPTERYPYIFTLLLKCVDPERGLYHRFGLVWTSKADLFEILLGHDVNEANLPCLSYDEESQLHVILLE